jgi:GDPmannose 4,6-dehydratase
MKIKNALIFGITDQDGSLLADFLLKKKYKVYGVARHLDTTNLKKLKIHKKIKVFKCKKIIQKNIFKIMQKSNCDEIYYLSGQSSVTLSEKYPDDTIASNTIPLLIILEFIRKFNFKIRLFYASPSEMYGDNNNKKCSINSAYDPLSYYSLSKVISLELLKVYRKQFNLKITNAVIFNHKYFFKKKTFLFNKITSEVNIINNKNKKKFNVANAQIKEKRDWVAAREYIKAMWKILQIKPGDFIIATGENYKLKIILKKLNLNFKKVIKDSKTLFKKNEPMVIRTDIN